MGRIIPVILIITCSNVIAEPGSAPGLKGETQMLRSVEVNAHGVVHKVDVPASTTRFHKHASEKATEEEPMHFHEVIRQVPGSGGKSTGRISHEKLAPSDNIKKIKDEDTAPKSIVDNKLKLQEVTKKRHDAPQGEDEPKLAKQLGKIGTFDMWILFFGCISILLVLDITVVRRLSHWQQDYRKILHIMFWILATLGFAVIMYLKALPKIHRGRLIATTWLNGYFMELAMNIDTFFVLTVIFAAWKTPRQIRHKPLQYGMVIGIPVRIFMYVAMEDVVELGRAPTIIMGCLLLAFSVSAWMTAGDNMSCNEDQEEEGQEDFLKYTLVTYLGKIIPLTPLYKEDYFFNEGKATLLFFVVLCIETSQAIFSLDAVSAKITEIPNVYIAATSTIFGMMTARALYFIFDLMIAAFAYMQYGVSVILAFLGLKLLFPVTLDIPLAAFLLLIVSVLLACVALSMLYGDDTREFQDSPENWKSIQEVREREKPQKKKNAKRFGTCQGLMSTDEAQDQLHLLRDEVENADPASSSQANQAQTEA